jgi:hypothetical protein
MCPYVTNNGEFLIFASNREQEEYDANPNENLDHLLDKYNSHDNGNLNIYYISTNFIEDLRPSKQ